ncbi:MAG TPA: HEAT repeat domain-containing protein [Steroidobacteraceae bacterium]
MDEKHDKPELVQRLIPARRANQSPCDGWLRQVINVSVPADVRVEAVLKLAERCRTHDIFQAIRSIVDHEYDSAAVRASIVRAMPAWDEASHPTMMLPTVVIVGALSVPGVRAVAVETLERMGAARGEKEARLLRHLASLRPGESGLRTIGSLGKLYGRDYRVQNLLRETMRAGNRWERALATSELFGLGQVETALDAAADPEPRVRKSLAAAIGRYREPRGAEVLGRLVHDPDPEVAHQARESLGGDTSAPPAFSWRRLLEELSEFRLTDPLLKAPGQSGVGLSVRTRRRRGTGARSREASGTLSAALLPGLPPRLERLPSRLVHPAPLPRRRGRMVPRPQRRLGQSLSGHVSRPGRLLAGQRHRRRRGGIAEPEGGLGRRGVADVLLRKLDPGREALPQLRRFRSDEIDGVCEWRNR